WAALSRKLIRHGYLQQTGEPFTVVEITDQGRLFLQDPQPLMLTKPMSPPAHKLPPAGDLAYDETLFNRLRYLRKALADERDVPAYVVFSDVALRQMARDYPTNEQEFLRISGVGSRKLEEFGPMFLKVIAEHLAHYPPLNIPQKPYSPPSSLSSRKRPLGETVQETLRCFRSGHSVEQIAKQRSLVPSTIYGHLEQAIQAGEPIDLTRLWTSEQELEMTAAFAKTGFGNLTGAKELLGDLYDYGQLRLFRAVHEKN
ncbi:MAG: helix-turn-helix domain-containing protein, partial [Nitrospirota bacterium]|nr:helix-turn-helix domain-containing protein [Nitrospirota bacterium]